MSRQGKINHAQNRLFPDTNHPLILKVCIVLVFILLGVLGNSSSEGRGTASAGGIQVTAVDVQASVPMYPYLHWHLTGSREDTVIVNDIPFTLPGTAYESDVFDEKLPSDIFAYYTQQF